MALTALLLFLCVSGVVTENNSSADWLRLVGGASRCNGTVELKHEGEWRRVIALGSWTLKSTDVLCRLLDCGSAVSGQLKSNSPKSLVWGIDYECVMRNSTVRDCVTGKDSPLGLDMVCSESVRLVSGSSLCSGSVQIWNQSWTWLCEGALDMLGAEVLCRELGCGAPSLLQGALSPLGLQTFHCEGNESALMDCPRSSSRTCSSGPAVNLTCTDWLRLVGGASRCNGTVEVKQYGEWRRVEVSGTPGVWSLELTDAVCRLLDCGSAVSGRVRNSFPRSPTWWTEHDCVKRTSAVRDCVLSASLSFFVTSGLDVVCSESVRLVSGSSLCSGSVQIWNQSWTWLCEGALDMLGAEVLCRELGCGAPSLLQGALSPLELQTFHCEGNESALMDCPRSSSRTCSSGPAVNLTCSEIRLVGGASRCAGAVELKHEGEWRRVISSLHPEVWSLELTDVVCRLLDCGSAVTRRVRSGFPVSPVWWIDHDCVKRRSAVRNCVFSVSFSDTLGLDVVCSDLLNRPIISLSVLDGVSELVSQGVRVLLGSEFRVTCSVEPQFPGGSFQLLSPAQNHTLPAVNHSAHFLFSDFGPAHRGNYTCVYQLEVFNHSFSSESPSLQIFMGASNSDLILRALLFPLVLITAAILVYFKYKVKARRATRRGARRGGGGASGEEGGAREGEGGARGGEETEEREEPVEEREKPEEGEEPEEEREEREEPEEREELEEEGAELVKPEEREEPEERGARGEGRSQRRGRGQWRRGRSQRRVRSQRRRERSQWSRRTDDTPPHDTPLTTRPLTTRPLTTRPSRHAPL
ncbi:hypothetical protein WMY93_010034 [Mugilogobius chulae]|uniref:SRCR domain-containing protein n=1 Tax=Mugilogobius chulae TaxID=88201 RepID=A0AAW0P6A9_9GOBI